MSRFESAVTESITGSPSATVEYKDGFTEEGVSVKIYPNWVRVQADGAMEYYPREEIKRIADTR